MARKSESPGVAARAPGNITTGAVTASASPER
jgi:hypothetical protein